MKLLGSLVRLLVVVAGALVGLVLFLVAVVAFVVFLLVRLLTGRKPDLSFRVNRNPWAGRQAPADDVVDVQVREVHDGAPVPPSNPLPLRAPDQS